ncbi:L-rhamnose-binding lectin CSL3-like [Saccostrea cucullata]|uniref:L-rhamnose-binding lectin CSL3-like n=1 Tax=Saccostrea cuccullata TaxID=36930 RepID=UPI002ED423A6
MKKTAIFLVYFGIFSLLISHVSSEAYAGVIVCERNIAYLRCNKPQRINILAANYGRTEGGHLCPSKSIKNTNCLSPASTMLTKWKCNGEQTCYISASNGVFGDPCAGTYKYLYVKYICQ